MAVRRPRATLRTRSRAVVAVAGAAAALVALGPAVADASTTPTTKSPAKAAAGWLARQLTGANRDHIVTAFTPKPDPGLAADVVLSFDAAGVAQSSARRVTKWLRSQAKSFTAEPGAGRDPGRLAKLLLVAEAQHANVHDFGGLNLVRLLKIAERSDGAFTDTGNQSQGDSPVSQSLALIALSHTGSLSDWPDAAAIRWLVLQQCGDGGFYYASQTSPPQNCNDVDSTAFAAQALLTVHSSVAASAVHWLSTHRNPDGGYGLAFGSSTPSSNANSTAVTVQALRQAGYSAGYGLTWLRKHQIGCSGLASRRGAVKYDNSGYDRSSAVYATAQAGQALAKKWLGDIVKDGASTVEPRLAC
ncbi:MAG TPA: prenyltransferase/squalene oxidase repeat-containing protein [Mycobacteriales bacterium]|jgi:hypothetical protein|nr:prenyltransferase/squalene oxidase repeat-containing protein [Mycobacteriales bacterium]